MKKMICKLLFVSLSALSYTPLTYAVSGVNCDENGADYDVCASGTITKLTYRQLDDRLLVSGIGAPGCGPAGWVLENVSGKKELHSLLLSAYMAKTPISLSRVGMGGCSLWDGIYGGNISEISLD